MNQGAAQRPARCWITKVGIVVFAIAALCFIVIELVQFVKTGSFARGKGFIMGPYLAMPMLGGLGASLLLLMVGGVVDSTRYGKWKRSNGS